MTAEPLVDYFAICGLDTKFGIEVERLSDGLTRVRPPLKRSYGARILAHYPQSRENNPFSESILHLCMPNGVRFCTQKSLDTQSTSVQFHTFVGVREDRSRFFGSALTFFERVLSPEIRHAMHTLHTIHFAELSSASRQQTTASNTLPRRGKHNPTTDTKPAFYDKDKDTLFVSTCIAIQSSLPIVSAFDTVLRALHKLSVSSSDLSIESHIYWLLFQLSLPSPGQSLKFSIDTFDAVCQRPDENELPFFDYSLLELFQLVGVENFVKVLTCALLEQQVLICSKVLNRLMLIAESLCALLFPFCWQHAYVPIVPYSQTLFLEAPVPFVMGFCYEDSIPEDIRQTNLCFIDADTGFIDLPEDVPKLPGQKELISQLEAVLEKFAGMREGRRTLRQFDYQLKRMSKSFDEDALSLIQANRDSAQLVTPLTVLQESESLARVQAIARKAGVDVELDNLQAELTAKNQYRVSPVCQHYFEAMRANDALREIFLAKFAGLFGAYEQFVVVDREGHNFDKASFLCDQPEANLPFVAAFIETQMWTSFVDEKLERGQTTDPSLKIFDQKCAEVLGSRLEESSGFITPATAKKEAFFPENKITRREESIDYIVPPPQRIPASGTAQQGFFPVLDAQLFEKPVLENVPMSPVRRRGGKKAPEQGDVEPLPWLKHLVTQRAKSSRQQASIDLGIDTGQLGQTNWKFVEQLLREAKAKTKRMLVEKLGREAVELGHTDLSVTGVEENTLVASFCDLLERIWSHGLLKKQGKSALWNHLLAQQDLQKTAANAGIKPAEGSFLSPVCESDVNLLQYGSLPYKSRAGGRLVQKSVAQKSLIKLASNFFAQKMSDFTPIWNSPSVAAGSEPNSPTKQQQRSSSAGRPRSPTRLSQLLRPLPTHIAYDLRNVLKMSEIKTEVGYARAFIRLALERKLLHKHLKELLSNQELLRALYKRYAFLRCDEEKEQLLYHILSMHAVNYFSFTNTFARTKIVYRIVIIGGGKQAVVGSAYAAAVWFRVGGTLCQTALVSMPKESNEMTFEHRNLGVLSTLRVGCESSSMLAKWYLDCVLVRNEITGHTYRFPCGRWFGRGIDDGSTERLLVAESIPLADADDGQFSTCSSSSRTPPRTRSPSARRTGDNPRLRISEIEHYLGDVVNNIVKHLIKNNDKQQASSRGTLTQLLCGERGLVWCLEQAFSVGLKAPRFFKTAYPWDYLDKVALWFKELLADEPERLGKDQLMLMTYMENLVSRLNASTQLGKEVKFQCFVLVTIRDQLLTGLLPLIARTPVTQGLYDDHSFFRSGRHLNFLTQLLNSLSDCPAFTLEQGLTWGF